MRIFLDLDGVVGDILTPWLALYNYEFNDTVKPQDIKNWQIEFFVKPAARRRIYEYLDLPELYDLMKPMPGAVEGIAELRDAGHRAVIATHARPGHMGTKYKWCMKHKIINSADDYVETKDKGLLRGDILLDDYPGNLVGFVGLPILFDAPHNKDAVYRRVRNWSDFLEFILRFSTTELWHDWTNFNTVS